MTLDEAKQHFQKLAQESGLDENAQKAVLQAMENEKFRNNLSNGYKRHEEYSRELDTIKSEKARLATWHQEELQKYNTYTQSIDKLALYQKVYGELEDDPQGLNNGRGGNGGGGGNGNRGGGGDRGMTKEEIDKYVEDKLKIRDGAYVGLTKTAVRISADYTRRFNDTLDVDAVEKLAIERGLPLDQAYKEYIAPKEQAATEERHKADIEKAKAEAVRDYQSRMKLPVDTKPKDAHPFWDRKSPEAGKSELDSDRSSKEEFMQGWNDYSSELQKTT